MAGATVGAVGVIGGAMIASNAADKASSSQAAASADASEAMLKAAGIQAEAAMAAAWLNYKATMEGIAEMKRQYDLNVERQMPWYEAGKWALGELRDRIGDGPPSYDYWGPWDDSMYEKSPYYDFVQTETINALDRSAAARGMLNSGQQQRAIMEYAHDLASTDWDKARARYYQDATWDMTVKTQKLTDYYNRLSPYQSLAGVGQNTATNLGNAGAQYANSLTGALQSGASALGAGITGAANAWAGYQDFAAQNALAMGNINASSAITQGNIWNNALNQMGTIAGNYFNPSYIAPESGQYWQNYNWNANTGTTLPASSGPAVSGDYYLA